MNCNVRTILIAVSVFVSTSAHAQTSSGGGPLTQANRPSALRGFSVVLVEGNLRTGPTTESLSLPPAAAKALADLKDFLPYKSFRLLDTQWTMGSGRMTGELRGTEGKSYALEVTHVDDLGFGDPASITISRFALSEASASTIAAGRSSEASQNNLFSGFHGNAASAWSLAHPLIDTSFRMKIGETVVVGTSRLQGDTALIVLLTAVPNGDKAPNAGR